MVILHKSRESCAREIFLPKRLNKKTPVIPEYFVLYQNYFRYA